MVVLEEAWVFHEQGINHVIWKFHQSISDKEKMYAVMSITFLEREYSDGAGLVPFYEEELEEIRRFDAQTGESWTPHEVVHPSVLELRDQFLSSASESGPSGVAAVEVSTPVVEVTAASGQPTSDPTLEP